jgi:hypothetical protein
MPARTGPEGERLRACLVNSMQPWCVDIPEDAVALADSGPHAGRSP